MSTQPNKLRSFGAMVAGAALATACGGGGGGGGTASAPVVDGTDVPVAATQSADAAFEFTGSVVASTSDTAEPLRVGDATLATNVTDEPKPL